MWPEASGSSPLSLCSIDADGSIYGGEEVEQMGGIVEESENGHYAKVDASTCSNLDFSLPTPPNSAKLISLPCRSGELLAAVPDATVLQRSQGSTDSLCHQLATANLEPALLYHSSPPFKGSHKISTSTYQTSFVDPYSSALIDIDLGSNEEVSNAELHSLELDYQQQVFEEIQSSRKFHRRISSFDTESLYSVCPRDLLSDTAMSTLEAPAEAKRVALSQLVASRNKSASTKIEKATSSSSPTPSSKTNSTPIGKPSSRLEGSTKGQAEVRRKDARKGSIDMSQLPSLRTKLNADSAVEVLRIITDSDDYQRAMDEGYEISVEVFDDDKDISIGRCNSKKYNQAQTQTMEKDASSQGVETEREIVFEKCDEQMQVDLPTRKDAEVQYVEKERDTTRTKVETFADSPVERTRGNRSSKTKELQDVDLLIALDSSSKNVGPSWCEIGMNCDEVLRQEVSIGTDALQQICFSKAEAESEEKGAQTDATSFPLKDSAFEQVQGITLCQICCKDTDCSADKEDSATLQDSSLRCLDEILAIEQDSDEAQAIAALKSLQCQDMVIVSVQNESTVQAEEEFTTPERECQGTLGEKVKLEEQNNDGEIGHYSETAVEDRSTAINHGVALHVPPLKRPSVELDIMEENCDTSPQIRKKGSRGKTQKQKEEEQRARDRLLQHLPPRRTCRQKQDVNYSEKAHREKATDSKVESDPRTIRSRKRSGESQDNSFDTLPITESAHPKRKCKKTKTGP